MSLHRSVLVASIGLGLLQAGCLADADDVNELDDVGLETLALGDPNGMGGTNGLLPKDAMPNMPLLWAATGADIDSAGNWAVNQLLGPIPGGNATLDYAIKCAVPSGTTVHGTKGNGILSTTGGWMTGGLLYPARNDLLTCMIAHLNPYGVEVPLRLSGDAVKNNGGSLADVYDFDEALWVARRTTLGVFEYYAWPLEDLSESCANPGKAINTRVCSKLMPDGAYAVTECNINVRDAAQMALECTQSATTKNWTCLGQPAIKTRLKTTDFLTLYPSPSCDPDPQ